MSDIDLSHVYAAMHNRGITPQAEIQATKLLAPGVFKVVAAVSSVDGEAAFARAVERLTDGAGRVIPGSYKARGRVAVAAVAANAKSQPMSAAFTMVTASSAVDPSGSIWRVENVGGKKHVVLESSDDLGAIFQDRMARRSVHLNPVEGRGLASVAVASGDLVRYVDAAARRTRVGVALDTELGMKVVSLGGKSSSLDTESVVASCPRSKLPEAFAKAPFTSVAKITADQMDKVIAYLAKAYGPASGPMLDRLRKLVDAGDTVA